MKRIVMAAALALVGTAALADSLRSDKHLLKIDVQPLSESSRQYNVQVFDAASRGQVTRLQVVTRGGAAADGETVAGGTRYKVHVEPHGDSYLLDFTADDGANGIDAMRGGFSAAPKGKPTVAPAARAGRDIKEPAVIRRVEPLYTEAARAVGAAGSVVLEVLIDRGGFVREATVTKSMGYGLDEAATDAVKQWRFEPSAQKNVPVEVAYTITLDFKP